MQVFCSYSAAAAAAAESLQSSPTLCDPIDGSPPGSPVPGILQARILEWVAISFSNAWKWKVKVKSLSRVQEHSIGLTIQEVVLITDKVSCLENPVLFLEVRTLDMKSKINLEKRDFWQI